MKSKPSMVVKLENINFRYSAKSPLCLKDISLQLMQGEYLVILGKNGSGKSTLGNIIAGLYSNFSGKIELFQTPLNESSHSQLIQKIGLVFQNPESQFIGSTVENDLVFSLEILRCSPNEMPAKIMDIVQRMNIADILYHEPASLSGGQKQKVAFASVLISDPALIIFDEPTSLLDQRSKQEIFQMINQIREEGIKTLIEITHNIERAMFADKILIIDEGEIKFFGNVAEFWKTGLPIIEKVSGLEAPFLYKLSSALQKQNQLKQVVWEKKEMVTQLCQLKKSKLKI